ncbi:hypothetical protein BJX65DRAFT_246432 [Aspergillus insuetus]
MLRQALLRWSPRIPSPRALLLFHWRSNRANIDALSAIHRKPNHVILRTHRIHAMVTFCLACVYRQSVVNDGMLSSSMHIQEACSAKSPSQRLLPSEEDIDYMLERMDIIDVVSAFCQIISCSTACDDSELCDAPVRAIYILPGTHSTATNPRPCHPPDYRCPVGRPRCTYEPFVTHIQDLSLAAPVSIHRVRPMTDAEAPSCCLRHLV